MVEARTSPAAKRAVGLIRCAGRHAGEALAWLRQQSSAGPGFAVVIREDGEGGRPIVAAAVVPQRREQPALVRAGGQGNPAGQPPAKGAIPAAPWLRLVAGRVRQRDDGLVRPR